VHYIITATEYLTQWVKAQPVKDCTTVTTTKKIVRKHPDQVWLPQNSHER